MTTPKVSIIIPVYNTAAYLPDALDSICKQTLSSLQIIVVDDGSTDNSLQIIQDYAAHDQRIEVITQPNQGQGVARNHGMKYAKGEYVYFMDSDDILGLDCLETCYEYCKKADLDYVTFDANVIEDIQQNQHCFNYERSEKIDAKRIWDSKEFFEYALTHMIFSSSVCLLFIKRTLLVNNQIAFLEGVIHEDNGFVVHMMLCAAKMQYLPICYFHRRIRSHSTMTNAFSMKNIRGYVTVAKHVRSLARQHHEWEALINHFLHNTFDAVIWQCHRLPWNEKYIALKKIISNHLFCYASMKSWLAFWLKRS